MTGRVTGTVSVLFPTHPPTVARVTSQCRPTGNLTLNAVPVAPVAQVFAHGSVLTLDTYPGSLFQLTVQLQSQCVTWFTRLYDLEYDTVPEWLCWLALGGVDRCIGVGGKGRTYSWLFSFWGSFGYRSRRLRRMSTESSTCRVSEKLDCSISAVSVVIDYVLG